MAIFLGKHKNNEYETFPCSQLHSYNCEPFQLSLHKILDKLRVLSDIFWKRHCLREISQNGVSPDMFKNSFRKRKETPNHKLCQNQIQTNDWKCFAMEYLPLH
jgi:hypothetical protein